MSTPERELKQLLKSVKKNAKARGLTVAIGLNDLLDMWADNEGRCSVTNIAFDFRRFGTRSRRPFVPSVDRIDCSNGYTRENCRLVCAAVNYALGDWGLDVLKQIAEGLLSRGFVSAPRTRAEGRLKGTYIRRKNGRTFYEVFLWDGRQRRYLGTFDSEIEAHRCWAAAKAARDGRPSALPSDISGTLVSH